MIYPWGIFFTGTNFRWDVFIHSFVDTFFNWYQSSIADLLTFTGDVTSSLISLRSLFKSINLALLYVNTFLCFCLFKFGFVEMSSFGLPPWSLIPGTSITCSISVGLDTKNKSSILYFLVGSLTSW